jgi:DNA-binding response OmpR family regulator
MKSGECVMSEKKKVLIVEDELAFAKTVKLRLESEGYEVMVAGDAYTGTQTIIRQDLDLIILDLMMPAGGGFSLLERIRKIPSKMSIPVVILTGKTIDDEVMQKAKEYDVADVIAKPYESKEFVERIKTITPP